MPIWKCENCHHEWEGTFAKCDWCQSAGYLLKTDSELEEMIASGRHMDMVKALAAKRSGRADE